MATRKELQLEIDDLHGRIRKLAGDQRKLAQSRNDLESPVPNGTLSWQDDERHRRRDEQRRLTGEIAKIENEIGSLRKKLTVANERLSVAPDHAPPAAVTDLETERDALIETREGKRELAEQLRVAIANLSLPAMRGDAAALESSTGLQGERDETLREIETTSSAIKQIDGKIAEARREFAERNLDANFELAKSLTAGMAQDAAEADKLAAALAAKLREIKQKRSALAGTNCIESARGNAIASPAAIARALVAAGFCDLTQIDSPRDKGEPLASSVGTLVKFIARPNNTAAA